MSRRRRVLAAALLVLLIPVVLGACNRGSGAEPVALDGSPRFPDDQGVVADVSFTELQLEGGKRYRITKDLQCFSTYTLASLPLLGRKGQYVQLGLEGDRVVWLASIGGVINAEGPVVYYTGHLAKVDKTAHRAIFRDGTVFQIGDGVEVPPVDRFVQVAVDPRTKAVTSFF